MTEFDVDDFLANYTHREAKAYLFDERLIEEHAQAEAELLQAKRDDERLNRDPQAPNVARRVVDLEERIDATAKVFTFRALSAKTFADLLAKHAPTKTQRAQGYDYDPDTFPTAMVAASSHDPELTPLQADQLRKQLAPNDWDKLFAAAFDANRGGGDVPKSPVAGRILRLNGDSETTPANGDSHDRLSLADS